MDGELQRISALPQKDKVGYTAARAAPCGCGRRQDLDLEPHHLDPRLD